MSDLVPVVRTVADLRQQVSLWRESGLKIGLVPTMGALHKGHLSLVDTISEKVDKVVVSIFVNPKQFGENEDLDKYPRQEQEDREKLTATGSADLVYAPTAAEMYPEGYASVVSVAGISEILEGRERPGHFDGVSTVVTKLLLQCLPDVAIFGEKDYQQLAVIRQFVRDLDIPVKVIGGALIRESDGLAYSSRNAYLNTEERAIAGKFNVILKKLVTSVVSGCPPRQAESDAAKALLTAGFLAVDYVEIVDPITLEKTDTISTGARVLAVARIGGVRLLDNMAINAK